MNVEKRPSLRILQVCSSLAWGGTEMHVPILSQKLNSRGHSIFALLHPGGSIAAESRNRGVPTETRLLGAYFNPLITYQLSQYIRLIQPDIIHLHLSRDLWQVVPALRLAGGGNIILTKHVGSYVKKFDLLHAWLYRHVARIITVSETLNKNVIETCPVEPSRVVTIHHALDFAKYKPNMYDPSHVRMSLNIPAECFVIGTVGRISPGKGYEDFFVAAKETIHRFSDRQFIFLIVGTASYGEESYFKEIKDQVKTLGIDKFVLFTGFRKDVPELLMAMDLFVFPSRAEGFGATLIEAMAMGIPCASTLSDGTLDTIKDEITGLVYPPGDVKRLCEVMSIIIEDLSLQHRLAEAGKSFVHSHFDLDVMTDRVEQVYNDVI